MTVLLACLHASRSTGCTSTECAHDHARRLHNTSGVHVQYEYLWADGVKVKKPVKLTAPQYIDALFDWIEGQVRNPAMPFATIEDPLVCGR